MKTNRRELSLAAFANLQKQVATAAALCSEDQMLALADQIHDAIRQLRYAEHNSVQIDVIPQHRPAACPRLG